MKIDKVKARELILQFLSQHGKKYRIEDIVACIAAKLPDSMFNDRAEAFMQLEEVAKYEVERFKSSEETKVIDKDINRM